MTADELVEDFLAELARWRAEHPGWTERQQLDVFSPIALWYRAGGRISPPTHCDRALYRRLMLAAGHLVRTPPGDGATP